MEPGEYQYSEALNVTLKSEPPSRAKTSVISSTNLCHLTHKPKSPHPQTSAISPINLSHLIRKPLSSHS